MPRPPQRQRVAAYAVVIRDDTILLSRLARRVSRDELWTLPGGGLDHGEDPRAAVVREVYEEAGLDVEIADTARVYSGHYPSMRRDGRTFDYHALRIVYDGWVAPGAPEPRVVEVDGSTAEARWVPLADVRSGVVPVVQLVREALEDYRPFVRQRCAVHGVIRRRTATGDEVLLVRESSLAVATGSWALPGGGIEHGESPPDALVREIHEETGLTATVGTLERVLDAHFQGTAPSGRFEDFHVIDLVFTASVDGEAQLAPERGDGTSDAAAWVRVEDLETGRIALTDLARRALDLPG